MVASNGPGSAVDNGGHRLTLLGAHVFGLRPQTFLLVNWPAPLSASDQSLAPTSFARDAQAHLVWVRKELPLRAIHSQFVQKLFRLSDEFAGRLASVSMLPCILGDPAFARL